MDSAKFLDAHEYHELLAADATLTPALVKQHRLRQRNFCKAKANKCPVASPSDAVVLDEPGVIR